MRGRTAELQMLVAQKCDKAEFLEAFTNMNGKVPIHDVAVVHCDWLAGWLAGWLVGRVVAVVRAGYY